MSGKDAVNVLAVMKEAAEDVVSGDVGLRLLRAAEAVAELVAADKAFDFYRARKIEADNIIMLGSDRSDDAYRRQASANHAYDRAVDRRRAALASIGGGA
jgi:hypothetical protein